MSDTQGIKIPNFLNFSVLSPGFKLSLIENLIGGDLTVWKSINVHLHIDQDDQSQSTAVITAQNNRREEENQEKTVLLLPEGRQSETLTSSLLPFRTGSYYIIDQLSWWDSTLETDQGTPLGPNLRLYPAVLGRARDLRTIVSKRKFTVDIQINTILLEEERSNGIKEHQTEFSTSEIAEIPPGDVKWIFTRYTSVEPIRFDDHALREIAISFDPSIVKEAVLIKRERIGGQRRYLDDYYLLVFKDK